MSNENGIQKTKSKDRTLARREEFVQEFVVDADEIADVSDAVMAASQAAKASEKELCDLSKNLEAFGANLMSYKKKADIVREQMRSISQELY